MAFSYLENEHGYENASPGSVFSKPCLKVQLINFYEKPTGPFNRPIYICQITDTIVRWAILGKPCDPSKKQRYGYTVYVAPFNYQPVRETPVVDMHVANNRAMGMPFGTRAYSSADDKICCSGNNHPKDFRPCCHYRWYPWKFKMPVGWGSWGAWSKCDNQCNVVRFRKCMTDIKGQCKVFWNTASNTPWKDTKRCDNKLCNGKSKNKQQSTTRSPPTTRRQWTTRRATTTRRPWTTRRVWPTTRPTTRKVWTTRPTSTTRWTPATTRNIPKHSSGWSLWTSWTRCSVTCGGGVQYRERECSEGCQKNHRTGQYLSWHQEPRGCAQIRCPVGHRSKWGNWQQWERCDKECGRGMQIRYMSCQEGACKRDAKSTYPTQTKPCYLKQHCPAWNEWGSWGGCSALCSGGRWTRNRTCKTGKPGFEGCQGPDFDNSKGASELFLFSNIRLKTRLKQPGISNLGTVFWRRVFWMKL